MVLNLLQRDEEANDPNRKNFASLRELIAGSHEDDAAKKRHLKHAAVLVRSLVRARILVLQRDSQTPYYWVIVNPDLQFDFSLYHALSLFLVEMVPLLEAEHPTYVGDLLTLVESVLENPEIVLRKQTDRAKQAALAEMKSQGVQYEERMEKLEGISYPKPLADWLFGNFDRFARMHPWVGDREIEPKSIGREMWETYASFNDYVKAYGLERSEGVLLRYLSQLYRTLQQNVPIVAKTEAVEDVLGFFRTTIELTDTSLLEEWESMLHPELLLREARGAREGGRSDLGARAGREPEGLRGAGALGDASLRARAGPAQLGRGGGADRRTPRLRRRARPPPVAADEWDAGRLEAALRAVLRGVHRPHHLAREPSPPLDPDPSDRRPPVGGAADPDGPAARQLLGHPRPRRSASRHLRRSPAAQDRDDLEVAGRARRRCGAAAEGGAISGYHGVVVNVKLTGAASSLPYMSSIASSESVTCRVSSRGRSSSPSQTSHQRSPS